MVFGIYGAGGSGRSFMNLALRYNKEAHEWEDIVYVDDVIGVSEWEGRKVYTFEEATKIYSVHEIQFIISQGEPATREKIYHKIRSEGYELCSYIDKRAVICDGVVIGKGCMIAPNVYIDANVKIEDNTMVYVGAVIGHDINIGKHCVISANSFIAGYSILGEKIYVGPGAMVRDRINIGEEAVLAMGAAIYKDVPAKSVAIGNPARNSKKQEGKGLFG